MLILKKRIKRLITIIWKSSTKKVQTFKMRVGSQVRWGYLGLSLGTVKVYFNKISQ